MANRIILGKNTNSNHGHSAGSPGYGLYVSRPGKDVTTCTADELIFNTDSGQGTSLGRIISMYQLAPIPQAGGGTNTTTTSSISAGTTVTLDISSIDFGIDFGFISFGLLAPVTNSASGSTENYSYSTSESLETISIENLTSSTLTVKSYVVPKYSNLAFF
jgi:hypothetical protein|tara:strand:- start:3268 stop:3750 length:483 start_codon:yes stop_codon:yes gene_type:complete